MADTVWIATIIEDGIQKELYVGFTEAGVDAHLATYAREHWKDRADEKAPDEIPLHWDDKRLQEAYFEGHYTEDLYYSGPIEVGA